MSMKAHTYYIIFGRPPIGEAFPLPRLAAPLSLSVCDVVNATFISVTHGQTARRRRTVVGRRLGMRGEARGWSSSGWGGMVCPRLWVVAVEFTTRCMGDWLVTSYTA